jgi:DNA-directed RNA polymerase specialized sigma24 family protein
MRRIACQEQHAFALLYRIYYRRLTRFLDRAARRPQMIEEILDDTMLVVWRRAATFFQRHLPGLDLGLCHRLQESDESS